MQWTTLAVTNFWRRINVETIRGVSNSPRFEIDQFRLFQICNAKFDHFAMRINCKQTDSVWRSKGAIYDGYIVSIQRIYVYFYIVQTLVIIHYDSWQPTVSITFSRGWNVCVEVLQRCLRSRTSSNLAERLKERQSTRALRFDAETQVCQECVTTIVTLLNIPN